MAATEAETTEQLHYTNRGWLDIASELYRHAGSRYPEPMGHFAEHLYRKAERACEAGRPGFTETVARSEAQHIRHAAHEKAVPEGVPDVERAG